MLDKKNIFIIGAGSWGTTIAHHLIKLKHDVSICYKNRNKVNYMIDKKKLNELNFSKKINYIEIINNKIENISSADIICIAVPSNEIRNIRNLLPLNSKAIILNLSKGIEIDSLKTISQILSEKNFIDKQFISTLSGPTHAEEILFEIPSAIVVSSYSPNTSKIIQKIFNGNNLRVYNNDDIIGVELGGSLKNIIAIASGISDGLGFGDNTKAAIVTRGCKEITNLSVKMGAKKSTFSGLSGVGDLMVTCFSNHSRNRFVGEKIAKGEKIKNIIEEMNMVSEGIYTSKAVYKLSKKFKIELPICESVYNILFKNLNPLKAVKNLINRDLSNELPL
tara:strand:- start:19170 stop:20174 length:1005 start_codon:yes stop_codon:yes gene_type:complete